MPKEDMDELDEVVLRALMTAPNNMQEITVNSKPITTFEVQQYKRITDSVMSWHKKQLQKAVIEARIDTAWHLHRNAGVEMMRGEDNDTDEYICTEYIPKLESQLKDMEGR